MQPNQKRAEGVSPLVIRALGVLVITLMAITASPTGSAAITDCNSCPVMADSDCQEGDCAGSDDSECNSNDVPEPCRHCGYTWQCTETVCPPSGPGGEETGKRLECVRGTQT